MFLLCENSKEEQTKGRELVVLWGTLARGGLFSVLFAQKEMNVDKWEGFLLGPGTDDVHLHE